MAQQYQLPAHLANRQRTKKLSEGALDGIGGSLPPHISIQGNNFTLIDAAGNEAGDEGGTIQGVIADRSDVMCKMYYGGKEYTPGSNDPPVCWSTNGLAPSRDAISPQHQDCATCPHNERGSAVSKISGASIKACRDEKHLAIYLPKYQNMLFRLVVTPGSFKNWSAFVKPFEGQQVDINDVMVTIGFQAKTNGVLTFQATDYVDAASAAFCDQAVQAKATDALVGRNDVPFAGYLAHAPLSSLPPAQRPSTQLQATPAEPEPFAQGRFIPVQPVGQLQGLPQQPPKQTRHRRTKAEIEAAKAVEQGNGPTPPQQAPFRPSAPPATGAPPFGIGQASTPNPEVAGMLNSIFKP